MLKRLGTIATLAGLLALNAPASAEPLLRWPLANPQILQDFGITEFAKAHQDMYSNGEHLGLDITESFNAPVLAAADGVVIALNKDRCPNFSKPHCNYGRGNWVIVRHPSLDLVTVYGHLAEPTTYRVGDGVGVGDIIGKLGASGNAMGVAHLHFAVLEEFIEVYPTESGDNDIRVQGREKFKNPLTLLPPLSTR